MSVRTFMLPTIAVTAVGASAIAVAAVTGVPWSAGAAADSKAAAAPALGLPAASTATKDTVFLAASLLGRNEVPTPGGPAVGDEDGRATAAIRIQGDTVWYALRWRYIAPPTAGHIHIGAKGANGAIKVPFFGGALPGTAQGVAGKVKVGDKATLDGLRDNPNGFYANLHTAEAPGGAVRGQFHKLNKPVDLNGVLNGGLPYTLETDADGTQEVPTPGKKTGDRDGRARVLLRPDGHGLAWSFAWSSVSAPTNGHIHKGARGANGPVVADLFAAPKGLPAGVAGLAGAASTAPGVAHRIAANPAAYYANLHTTEFDGGAVRGQLGKAQQARPGSFTAPVLVGAQIYRCTAQAGGGHAYTQDNVSALLRNSIRHTFVQPGPAGPPQWVAPDGSAVTGKAVTRTPNGEGNIPELVLDATQSGDKTGLLSATTQILRLNTQGGVAPAGNCDPQARPIARVPYKADYVFLG